jgi:hypothetical protein
MALKKCFLSFFLKLKIKKIKLFNKQFTFQNTTPKHFSKIKKLQHTFYKLYFKNPSHILLWVYFETSVYIYGAEV